METKDKYPEVHFRKQIAEEMSREELIDRCCELNELYNNIRAEWIEYKLRMVSLPSDEEIDAEAKKRATTSMGYLWGNNYKWFRRGARWMRSLIASCVNVSSDEIKKVREAVGLLNSMVLCGEKHSDKSMQVFDDAMKIITSMRSVVPEPIKEEPCVHPFETVISKGAEHNCTLCGQDIKSK